MYLLLPVHHIASGILVNDKPQLHLCRITLQSRPHYHSWAELSQHSTGDQSGNSSITSSVIIFIKLLFLIYALLKLVFVKESCCDRIAVEYSTLKSIYSLRE